MAGQVKQAQMRYVGPCRPCEGIESQSIAPDLITCADGEGCWLPGQFHEQMTMTNQTESEQLKGLLGNLKPCLAMLISRRPYLPYFRRA